jgi:hypothetical protein
LPVSRDLDRAARPAPKPISSIGQPRSPASSDDDDFIDADVIDEEAIDEDEKPMPRPILGTPQPAGSTRGGSPFSPRREETPKTGGPAPIGGQQRPTGASGAPSSPFASRTPQGSNRPMGRPVSDLFGSKPPAKSDKSDEDAADDDENVRYDPLDDTP